MSNPYFKFKHFTIYQDKCAMKVCTDACLFGAWVSAHIGHREPVETGIALDKGLEEKDSIHHLQSEQGIKILDVGSGTGLLSLMLAQQINGTIDTIEIHKESGLQAKENVDRSKWKNRINVIHADVKHFVFKNGYDLIISNPPFYENDRRAALTESNMARHDETLTLEALISIVSRQLSSTGSFVVLVPYHRLAYCMGIAAKYNLFPVKIVGVKQTPRHDFFRCMIAFKKQVTINVVEEELVIKDGDHYTPEFKALLKDYYLNL